MIWIFSLQDFAHTHYIYRPKANHKKKGKNGGGRNQKKGNERSLGGDQIEKWRGREKIDSGAAEASFPSPSLILQLNSYPNRNLSSSPIINHVFPLSIQFLHEALVQKEISHLSFLFHTKQRFYFCGLIFEGLRASRSPIEVSGRRFICSFKDLFGIFFINTVFQRVCNSKGALFKPSSYFISLFWFGEGFWLILVFCYVGLFAFAVLVSLFG